MIGRFAELNIDLYFVITVWLIRHKFVALTPVRAEVLAEENADRVLRRGKRPLRV